MPNSIRIGKIEVAIGDSLKAGSFAQADGLCPEGLVVEVKKITETQQDGAHIAIYSKSSIGGWHSLDGTVGNGHGYWITKMQLVKGFTLIRALYEVNQPTVFKGLDLQKKKCKVLFEIKSTKENPVMVEFIEPISGCGGDGFGKSGHCLVLPKKALTLAENKPIKF